MCEMKLQADSVPANAKNIHTIIFKILFDCATNHAGISSDELFFIFSSCVSHLIIVRARIRHGLFNCFAHLFHRGCRCAFRSARSATLCVSDIFRAFS